MRIRARAPLRLGIAGGGTDVSPYCDDFGGFVLNATINKYAYTIIETNDSLLVEFVAADQELTVQYAVKPILEADGVLDLHKAVYNRMMTQFNGNEALALRITTFCEAPSGSGLGSSSTLVVSMVKAFVELMNLPLGDYDIAHLAFEIERIDAGLNGGKQDQYSATFGGVNFIEFYANDRVIVNPLRIKNWIISELEASLVLFYTGRSRESANIIDEQTNNVVKKKDSAIEAMHELKQAAVHMKESLLKGDFDGLALGMQETWIAKKRTAKAVSNAHIDEIYEIAMNVGAKAGKVSGAGGGGFMMFLVDPACRVRVQRALSDTGGEIMTCHFTKHGTQGWRLD